MNQFKPMINYSWKTINSYFSAEMSTYLARAELTRGKHNVYIIRSFGNTPLPEWNSIPLLRVTPDRTIRPKIQRVWWSVDYSSIWHDGSRHHINCLNLWQRDLPECGTTWQKCVCQAGYWRNRWVPWNSGKKPGRLNELCGSCVTSSFALKESWFQVLLLTTIDYSSFRHWRAVGVWCYRRRSGIWKLFHSQ